MIFSDFFDKINNSLSVKSVVSTLDVHLLYFIRGL